MVPVSQIGQEPEPDDEEDEDEDEVEAAGLTAGRPATELTLAPQINIAPQPVTIQVTVDGSRRRVVERDERGVITGLRDEHGADAQNL
jgi:hypothetical protein